MRWRTASDQFRYGGREHLRPTPRRLQGPLMPVSYINLIDQPGHVVLAQGTTAADGVTDAADRVKTNVVIPSNVTAEFAPGAVLNIDAGRTVTFAGPVDAGAYRIFTGSGTAAFAPGVFREIDPEWWGGGAAGQTAANAAAVAAGNAIVFGAADYPMLVYGDGGILTYSFDDDGFSAQSGHNSPATHVLQNIVDVPANGQTLGHWAAKGPNSLNSYHTYTYILATATDVTSTSMDSTITIGVMGSKAESGANMQPNVFYVFSGTALTLPAGTSLESASGTILSLGNLAVRGVVIQGMPAANPGDGNLPNGSILMFSDDAANTLKVRWRKGDGTLRTATLATA